MALIIIGLFHCFDGFVPTSFGPIENHPCCCYPWGELHPMDFACRIMALPLQVSDSELLLFLGVKG